MRSLLAAIIALSACAIFGGAASAAGPVREPAPPGGPFTVTDVCAFPVQVAFPEATANTYSLTFTQPDGTVKQIFTGRLVATFTNLDNPTNTITTNISGPSIYTFFSDNSATLVFLGRQGGPNGTVFDLGAGRTVFVVASDGSVTRTQVGHFLDLCKVLA
jgi:hypothetical protein